MGVYKKFGAPSITPEYFSRVMYDENFLGLPHMGIAFILGSTNLVIYIPLIMQALLESGLTLKTYVDTLTYSFAPRLSNYLACALQRKVMIADMKS